VGFKRLMRPVALYGAESWTLNKDIANDWLRWKEILRRMFGGITINESWRKRYEK